jgi:hypothetical protein
MSFLSSGNKIFNILEFPKCTGNAIPEITEPVYADDLLQNCVINMSDVATNYVFLLYFSLYISASCIYLHFSVCKLFNPNLVGEMPDLYIRNLLIK